MYAGLTTFDAAQRFVLSIEHSVTRELTSLVFGKLVHSVLHGSMPQGEFDALYFAKVVKEAMSCHDTLRELLNGGTILWPTVDEDPR